MSYHDTIKYTCRLQCFIAEIQAFLVWENHILGHFLQKAPTTQQCFHGAYVTSSTDFKYLSSLGVPVFYLTCLSPFELPPLQYMHITELPSLCELHTWTNINVTQHQRDVIKGRLLHSKPLMFYPPHVNHLDPHPKTVTGIARLSVFTRNGLIRAVTGINFGIIMQFKTASLNIHTVTPQFLLMVCTLPTQFHLFTSCPTSNSMKSVLEYVLPGSVCITSGYFIMRNTTLIILHNSLPQQTKMPLLLHSIFTLKLGRTSCQAIGGRRIVGPHNLIMYDHHVFWHYGSPQLLGIWQEQLGQKHSDPNNAYYSLSDNLSPFITPGCQLELKDFENKALCNMVIYDLALTNHKLQFEKTDDFVMHTNSMSLEDHYSLEVCQDLFCSSWDIPRVAFSWHNTSWEENLNWKHAIPWYTYFCLLLSSWPCENDLAPIDWEKDLSDPDQWAFTAYSHNLLIF